MKTTITIRDIGSILEQTTFLMKSKAQDSQIVLVRNNGGHHTAFIMNGPNQGVSISNFQLDNFEVLAPGSSVRFTQNVLVDDTINPNPGS